MNKRSYNEVSGEETIAVDDIRSLHMTIWNLGERGAKLSLEQDIQNIASLLQTEYSKHGDLIFESLRFCLLNLPYKASLYVAVLSLLDEGIQLNIKEKAKGWVEKNINEALADSNEWKLGQALRIWCELASNMLVSSDGLIELFQKLAEKGHSLLSGSDNQRLAAYWIGKSILLSLPFGAPHLKQKEPIKFDSLIESLKGLFSIINNNLKFNGITANSDNYSTYLFNLATPFEELVKNEFRFELNILNPDQSIASANLQAIAVDDFELPSDVSHLNLLRSPFQVHKDAHRRNVSIYDCWLLNCWLSHILDFFAANHSKCIETLFAAVPEDFGNPARIIQNVLFGELLRTHQHDPFYHIYPESLLVDGCRFSKLFPPALAKTVFHLVLDEMEELNYRAIVRLSSWFALHLSSFDFKWPWDEWKETAEDWPSTSLKRIFMQESLDQLIRLSY
jgi:nuclear cap-binding protein subunit 1